MNDATPYTIGEVARLTGLSVKTIRFYSDAGVVPFSDRSPAGYRLYDLDAVLRLELVRTLRELGMDLATIRRVLDRKVSLADVVAVHADAVDLRIRTLRLHRSVLRAVALSGSSPEEITLMHKLTRLTAAERRRLIDDFVTSTFDVQDRHRELATMVRMAAPDLPDDPSPEQIRAWAELAELIGEEDFRHRMRKLAEQETLPAGTGVADKVMELIRRPVAAAKEAGVDPLGPEARPIADSVVAAVAGAHPHMPDAELRGWLIQQLEAVNDPRVEQYWRLVWAVNGWQVLPGLLPDAAWLLQALRQDRTP
ncbi:MerR family transcriptional regulator [Streptomyces sp. NPDC020951]|uniref:MerR family transcriptional regulator n=1 Tax=Streptomyces sp. NPDC020951 TaxID=3365104 RepID=UPI003788417D